MLCVKEDGVNMPVDHEFFVTNYECAPETAISRASQPADFSRRNPNFSLPAFHGPADILPSISTSHAEISEIILRGSGGE
jgi:hypothetical protein